MQVEALYIAPVKSLALLPVERVHLAGRGIVEDRRFFIADARSRMYSQRENGALALVSASYDPATERLELRFPDGSKVGGTVEPADSVTTSFFGVVDVAGGLVAGPFAEALSAYAGEPVRLVMTDQPGAAYDAYPVSLCSTGSISALAAVADVGAIDKRRFRPNILISGTDAHGEDAWIGGDVAVGDAVLRVERRDSRCVMTQVNPDTGEQDLPTLKLIAGYRTDLPKKVYFGVYCTVVRPGAVRIGDALSVIAKSEVTA